MPSKIFNFANSITLALFGFETPYYGMFAYYINDDLPDASELIAACDEIHNNWLNGLKIIPDLFTELK